MTNSERQKRYRDRQNALRSGGIVTETVTEGGRNVTVNGGSVTAGVTPTDAEFEEDKPGYYIFEEGEPWGRKCWKCGEEFETRLEMNKFCSPGCKDEWLSGLGSDGRSVKGIA